MIDPLNTIMYGDLVYNHRNWICPVVGSDYGHIAVIAHHYGESVYTRDLVSPIPMSDEILSQLGWKEVKKGDKGYCAELGCYSKQFKHPFYTTVLSLGFNENTHLYWIINGNIIIRYVHDLQHVLLHTVQDRIEWDEEQGFHIVIKEFGTDKEGLVKFKNQQD